MGVVVGTCTSVNNVLPIQGFFSRRPSKLGGGGGGGGEKQALCIGHCSGMRYRKVQR